MVKVLGRFHRNEDGMEAIQVAMVIATASVILLVIWSKWTTVKTWFTNATTGASGVSNTIK